MAILHTESFEDDIRLEIVDGLDIMESYKNNSKVSSCQSRSDRWQYTEFYSHVRGAQLIRLMRDDVLVLRALYFHTNEGVKILGRSYARAYPYDYCSYHEQNESVPGIIERFEPWRKKFITQNPLIYTNRYTLNVDADNLKYYPCGDIFAYLSADRSKLTNLADYKNGFYSLSDFSGGCLGNLIKGF